MKKTLLAIILTTIICGCEFASDDLSRQNASKYSRGGTLYQVTAYRYLVRDTLGNVIYLEYLNTSNNQISRVDTAFYAKSK